MGIMEEDNFVEGEASSYSEDIDSEYEFDAPHFHDFSLDDSESEAENWFRYAHEYPPSPFIVKMKFMKAAKSRSMKSYKTNSRKKIEDNKKTSLSSNSDCEIDHKPTSSREMKIKGVKHDSHIPQDTMKAAKINLSGPSFMKPTASHLAKQNKGSGIRSRSFGSRW